MSSAEAGEAQLKFPPLSSGATTQAAHRPSVSPIRARPSSEAEEKSRQKVKFDTTCAKTAVNTHATDPEASTSIPNTARTDASDASASKGRNRQMSVRYAEHYLAKLDNGNSMEEARWRKLQGIDDDQKIFIITGAYPDIQKAFFARGWRQNPVRDSPFWDFKWTLKSKDIAHSALRPDQKVNHFSQASRIVTKSGLRLCLQALCWFENVDINTFFPRCYDMSLPGDFCDFVFDYCSVQAERHLKAIVQRVKAEAGITFGGLHLSKTLDDLRDHPGCTKTLGFVGVNFGVLAAALSVVQKRCFEYSSDMVDQSSKAIAAAAVITRREWEIVYLCDIFAAGGPVEQQSGGGATASNRRATASSAAAINGSTFDICPLLPQPPATVSAKENPEFGELQALDSTQWQAVLEALKLVNDHSQCQSTLSADPPRNVWIVKPAGKSRGRGIECLSQLGDIVLNRAGREHKEAHFVVQKYIERPLKILNRKFDIRQWVMVTGWNPLTVWFYNDSYCRFCADEFNLDDLGNRYIHLANNSVQKNSSRFKDSPIEGNMWHSDQLQEYLIKAYGTDAWTDKIHPAMKKIATWSLMSAQDVIDNRPNSFELYGFDIMIDEELNSWLIEINSSPDFSYSTAITKRLVRRVADDIIKVVLDFSDHVGGRRSSHKSQAAEAKWYHKQAVKFDTGRWELLYRAPFRVPRPVSGAGHDFTVTGGKVPMMSKAAADRRAAGQGSGNGGGGGGEGSTVHRDSDDEDEDEDEADGV